MRKYRITVVFLVAALAYLMANRLGFGNRIYTDFVGVFELEQARLRESWDFFTLGFIVYVFGGIASKVTKTSFMAVFATALIIVLADFGRRTIADPWPYMLEQVPIYAGLLPEYFSGVFAAFGLWTFCARLLISETRNGNT